MDTILTPSWFRGKLRPDERKARLASRHSKQLATYIINQVALSWWARASSIHHMHYTYKHLLSTYCVLDSQQPKPNKTSVYPWEGVRSVLHEDKTASGHVC